jgi:uncharacterized protein (DUF1330 family)
MKFEMLVGLHVTDRAMYAEYRKAMLAILRQYGGGFRYDFEVSQTLKSEVDHTINRVFAIYFDDESSRDRFFSDPEYKAVRERFFAGSVKATVVIAEYPTGGQKPAATG